ncbi:MAG: Uma2 family endonuclease [Gemmatimonadetes bacterium]|nr:Uma2 family endonuclease [Gemmatimonadota bacterium]
MALELLKGPFTADDYHRLGQLGILHEDDRVELVDGQVVVMSPIGRRHAGRVNYLTNVLVKLVGDRGVVSVQNPLLVNDEYEPQPDILVLKPNPTAYSDRLPGPDDVLLLIEVADSSLDYDREIKIPRYARAGIADVWLVDLTGDRVDMYRDPARTGYRSLRTARRGETVEALLLPEITLNVEDILG